MTKINKLYAKFLEEVTKETNKETIIKKFNKTFKNTKFDSAEDRFNQEFLQCLFNRKKIKYTNRPALKCLHLS